MNSIYITLWKHSMLYVVNWAWREHASFLYEFDDLLQTFDADTWHSTRRYLDTLALCEYLSLDMDPIYFVHRYMTRILDIDTTWCMDTILLIQNTCNTQITVGWRTEQWNHTRISECTYCHWLLVQVRTICRGTEWSLETLSKRVVSMDSSILVFFLRSVLSI